MLTEYGLDFESQNVQDRCNMALALEVLHMGYIGQNIYMYVR